MGSMPGPSPMPRLLSALRLPLWRRDRLPLLLLPSGTRLKYLPAGGEGGQGGAFCRGSRHAAQCAYLDEHATLLAVQHTERPAGSHGSSAPARA